MLWEPRLFGRYLRVYLCIPLYILHYNLVWIVLIIRSEQYFVQWREDWLDIILFLYFENIPGWGIAQNTRILVSFHYPTDFTKLYGLETQATHRGGQTFKRV